MAQLQSKQISDYIYLGDMSIENVENDVILTSEVRVNLDEITGIDEEFLLYLMDQELKSHITSFVNRLTQLGFLPKRLSDPVSSARQGILLLSRDYALHV